MCPEEHILSAYLDGEVEPPWRPRIEDHLRDCASCRQALEEMQWVRERMRAQEGPDHRPALERFRTELSLRRGLTWPARLGFWRRKVSIPLPVAVLAAALIFLLGASLLLLQSRMEFRRMSIKREPSGVTEVHVAAPIEDLEVLLKALDKEMPTREIVITLPKDSRFLIMGEPKILRAADFIRSQ